MSINSSYMMSSPFELLDQVVDHPFHTSVLCWRHTFPDGGHLGNAQTRTFAVFAGIGREHEAGKQNQKGQKGRSGMHVLRTNGMDLSKIQKKTEFEKAN